MVVLGSADEVVDRLLAAAPAAAAVLKLPISIYGAGQTVSHVAGCRAKQVHASR